MIHQLTSSRCIKNTLDNSLTFIDIYVILCISYSIIGGVKMVESIRIAVLNVGDTEFNIIDNFKPELENKQAIVGGYVRPLTIEKTADGREIQVWYNEDGKLAGLEPNFVIATRSNSTVCDLVVGYVFITSADSEGNLTGLTDEDLEFLDKNFVLGKLVLTPYGMMTNALLV